MTSAQSSIAFLHRFRSLIRYLHRLYSACSLGNLGPSRFISAMVHMAFIAPPFLGHLNPMKALARTLVERGHRATFLHMTDAAALLDERVFGFVSVGLDTHPAGQRQAIHARLSSVRGFRGARAIVRDVAATTDMLCRELPAALRRIDAELIVCDQVEPAGALVADHLGLPFVSLASALPLNRDPDLPPPFVPWSWKYTRGKWRRRRNIAAYRANEFVMRPLGEVLLRHSARFGLPPRWRINQCFSPLAQISQLVPGLDFPRSLLPSVFHYCGPLRHAAEAAPLNDVPSFGENLVFASLGSLHGSSFKTLNRICTAIRRCGLEGLVAHGGGLSATEAARLPFPTYGFVPQEAVLKNARLAILHGGLNTVLDALAVGVPIVVIPLAFEQPAIAARILAAGVGVSVGRYFLSGRRIAAAIDRVLATPSYREAAQRMREEIMSAGGVKRAADIVEGVAKAHCSRRT